MGPCSGKTCKRWTTICKIEQHKHWGLPEELVIRHLETDRYRLFPAGAESYTENAALGIFHLASTQGIAEAVEIVDGRSPNSPATAPWKFWSVS
ncbi:MAG: hypothetical protein HC804_15185 [Anaerolineae bacterium]|nr:hypothetical protein [Anaerolineae bacterium]